MAEKVLNKIDERVVFWWLKLRDVVKVAQRLNLAKTEVKTILDRIEVQDEIERQENVLISERMKIQANAENLTNDLLDRETLSLIMLDAETNGTVKLKAIELGYILTGRIESGNTRSLEAKEGPDAKPNFYQAFVPGGVNVTVTPILPEEAKDHHFPIAPPPAKLEPVTGTVQSVKPRTNTTSKVKVW